MGKFNSVKGDLIKLSLEGSFDVICHGTNCFNTQGKGIALQMKKTFGTDTFKLEAPIYKGDINKLGQIDYMNYELKMSGCFREDYVGVVTHDLGNQLTVVNAYTQYGPGPNLDYNALRLCLRKINHKFMGKHIGLPLIGCGIAGGIWDINEFGIKDAESSRKYVQLQQKGFKDVKTIIQEELKDVDVTIVMLKNEEE